MTTTTHNTAVRLHSLRRAYLAGKRDALAGGSCYTANLGPTHKQAYRQGYIAGRRELQGR